MDNVKDILAVAITAAGNPTEFENSNDGQIVGFLEKEFGARTFIYYSHQGLFSLFLFLLKLKAILLFSSYSIVYFTNCYSGIFFPLAKLRGKKVVIEAEDVYSFYLQYKRRRGMWGKIDYYIKRLFCLYADRADLIVTKYETIARTVCSFSRKRCNVKVIRFLLDPVFLETKHRDKDYSEPAVFGYWGNLKDIKLEGLDTFVTALAGAENKHKVKLLLIGGPPEKINKLKDKDKIDLVAPGYVYPPEIGKYLSEIDYFIFPMNGLNKKIYEALALGLPVIAPENIFDELTSYGEFIFCPETAQGYSEAIERLMLDKRKPDYGNNRKKFFKIFHEPTDSYRQVFNELLKR